MFSSNNDIFYEFKESKELFESFIQKDYLSKQLQNKLPNSDILIIPIEQFHEIKEPLFPVGTEELYQYFLDNNLSIDICIDDENYQELALHGDIKRLGKFVVKSIALPVFIGVMISFVSNEILTKDNEAEIKISITVVDSSKSKHLEYEGSAKHFIELKDDIKNNFWIDDE